MLASQGASPGVVGVAVAFQSAAWLLVSLPAGALADRFKSGGLMASGAALIMAGGLAGAAVSRLPNAPVWLLGACVLTLAAGVVLNILTLFAILPRLFAGSDLPRVNSRVEFARALAALAAPALAGFLVKADAGSTAFLMAAAAGAVALFAGRGFEQPDAPPAKAAGWRQSFAEGARVVWSHPYLRSILFCAIFWNLAFMAFATTFPVYAVSSLGLDSRQAGLAWATMGAGQIAGSYAAPRLMAALPPGWLLVFGPAASLAAIALFVFMPKAMAFEFSTLVFFLIGFGPMIWLIVQTTLRQLVTPTPVMGRAAAILSASIYGVRPLGALIGGGLMQGYGAGAALGVVVALFAGSLAAILLSPMPGLKELPERVAG